MNYIKRLEKDKAGCQLAIIEADKAILEFRAFLQGPKFTGVDLDGGRKDWISTSDVLRELDNIRERMFNTLDEQIG